MIIKRFFGFVVLGMLAGFGSAQDLRVSPFSMVRWNDQTPEVQIDKRWYTVVSIDGQPIENILEHCRQAHGGRWAKRFCEDLPRLLSEMGHPLDSTVKLVLTDLEKGKTVTLDKVPMTKENRTRIWSAKPRPDRESPWPVQPERKLATKPDERYAFLLQRYSDDDTLLAPDRVGQDLTQLESLLENQFSYLGFRDVDHRAALDTVRLGVKEGISKNDLHIQLRMLVALFGDGHSRVRGVYGAMPRGFLPARVADVDGRLVVLQTDSSELLDANYPYLVALDGIPVERWLEAAARLAPQGSPQLVRTDAIRFLSWVNHLRTDLELPTRNRVEITLTNPGGKRTQKLIRDLADSPSFAAVIPRGGHHVFDGNIGYLRIHSMGTDERELQGLVQTMKRYRNTNGLIIDVRGNGGGRRDALLALFPFFRKADDAPHVGNVAVYRLPPGVKRGRADGYLSNRYLYPQDWTGYGEAEHTAIDAVKQGFRPEWEPDPDRFSRWHYLVLGGTADFHYEKPVTLLIDTNCFSATDIFIGAFRGWRNVTLMGTPSGGGSGRSQEYELINSGFKVRLSSMASFLPDGAMYDGNGIHPDVLLKPTLDDYLDRGDSVLEEALRRMREE